MRENQYQAELIKKIKDRFPECVVVKNDPNYIQGIPDLSIFYKKKWAWLETKKSEDAPHRPNQDYYIDKGNKMSFARFICPENQEEVLNELQQTLQPRRKTRIS